MDYRQAVFVDDTAFTAFMNAQHPYYAKARSLFLDLDDLDRCFVTTNYVVFDVHQWLRNQFGYAPAEYFLNTVDKAVGSGKLALLSGSPELEMEARRLVMERPELRFSLSEALTAVFLSAYRILRIFTFNANYALLPKLDAGIKVIPTI
jgi:predicted nucleic acid-binding protein